MGATAVVAALFAATVAVLAPVARADFDACTADDIGHTYLPCDQSSQTRVGVYFYTRPCQPTDAAPLPAAVSNLPCNIQCDAGSRLPFGATSCATCEPGTYSIGGADLYTSWDTMPLPFRTDCTGANCDVWYPNGTYVATANVTGFNNVDARLYLVAQFVRNSGNYIQFAFRVDAENCGSSLSCDGLRFHVDNVLVMPLVSTSLTWQTVRLNVSAGTHEFRWTYHKDYSISFGEDRAAIQSIELFGTKTFTEECAKCPPGTFSQGQGNSACKECDYNKITSDSGMSTCTPCGANEYAFTDSSKCTPLPACTARDYFVRNKPCQANGKFDQEAVVKDIVPGVIKACDPSNRASVAPPTVQTQLPCTCDKGLVLQNGVCRTCPAGQASYGGTCNTCPVGSAAPNMIEVTDWSSLPPIFKTTCLGDCDPGGWLPRGSAIHTGYNFRQSMDSYLNTVQTFANDQGTINFNLVMAVSGSYWYRRDVFLQFVVSNQTDGQLISATLRPSYSAGTLAVSNATFSITNAGTYNITWRFHVGDGGGFDRNTYAELTAVRFTGIADGGAYRCQLCPPGFGTSVPGAVNCDECKPGTYSPASGDSCKPVPDGYFTSTYRATSYIACGPGTTSNANHTDCETDCTFTTQGVEVHPNHLPELKYDLSPLSNPERMYFAGVDSSYNSYFLNMCYRGVSNVTCFTGDGTPVPSFACQTVKGWGYSVDLGSIIGFTALQPISDAHKGLIVTFANGTPGCGATYGTAQPRRSNMTMICDLQAGVGTPTSKYNATVEYPARSCVYNFVWRTKYACPVCTDADFEFDAEPCINGYKAFTYRKLYDCYGEPNPANIPAPRRCYLCPRDARNTTCSGQGSCDENSGLCNCQSVWTGPACNECNTGYFGQNCQNACPGGTRNPCSAHGQCDAGVTGTGVCACSTGWTGAACSVCAAGFDGPNCEPLPAAITDVLPGWAILLIIVAVIGLVVSAVLLYRAKKAAEYKYSRLLSSQPIELGDDAPGTPGDNLGGLPDDEERERAENERV